MSCQVFYTVHELMVNWPSVRGLIFTLVVVAHYQQLLWRRGHCSVHSVTKWVESKKKFRGS